MKRSPEQRHAYIMRRWGLAIERLRTAKKKADKERAAKWSALWGMATGIRQFPGNAK